MKKTQKYDPNRSLEGPKSSKSKKKHKNTTNKAILGVGCPKERHNDEKRTF